MKWARLALAATTLAMAACQILSGISDLQVVDDGGTADASGDRTVDGPGGEASVEAGDDGAADTAPAGEGGAEGATTDGGDAQGGDGQPGDGGATDAGDGGGNDGGNAETGPEAGADADAASAEAGSEAGGDGGKGSDASDAAADVVNDVVEASVPYEAGVPTNSPSCMGLPSNCGPSANESCCETITLTGGSFVRGYDGVDYTDASAPATLDYSFTIDRFEVTVARFDNFIHHLPQNPPQGAGNYRNEPMTGWNTAWNTNLPSSTSAYVTQVTSGSCSTPFYNAGNPTYPMNCVTWYEAFNFCIWDSMGAGRLPTEAEWNYLAAAGNQQRVYPWSSPSTALTIDSTFAWYQCGGTGGTVGGGPCSMPLTAQPVGTDPKGDGFFGQADLAGSLSEATLDWFGPFPVPCTDCANVTPTNGQRVYRGGSWGDTPGNLHAAARVSVDPAFVGATLGWRCVH